MYLSVYILVIVNKKAASFVDYITPIVQRRHIIIKMVLIVAGVTAIISLLIPNQYTATATILPPNPQQEAMLGMLSTQALSFGGLSGLSKMLPGATTPSDLFAAILNSDRIMNAIIQEYDLKTVFKTSTMDDTYKMLRSITRIRVSPEGIIQVSVTWYDKFFAANIANSFMNELDMFNNETSMTVGRRYRVFIERRLKESIDTLSHVEDALRKFQEKHRTVALDVELENLIAAIAELKSQIILLEVQKAAIGPSGSAYNPHARNIDKQLRELKKQLAKIEFGDSTNMNEEFGAGFAVPFSELPEVAVEYARLVRDVETQSAIFLLLTQQYEQAKIMEAKDTPTVQILDIAKPPERKSTPKRTQIVILSAALSLVLGVLFSYFSESLGRIRQRPEESQKWAGIYTKVGNDLRTVKQWISKLHKK